MNLSPVIASEAKQSDSASKRRHGLLRRFAPSAQTLRVWSQAMTEERPFGRVPDLSYWQRCIRPSSRRTIVPGWQMMPLRAA